MSHKRAVDAELKKCTQHIVSTEYSLLDDEDRECNVCDVALVTGSTPEGPPLPAESNRDLTTTSLQQCIPPNEHCYHWKAIYLTTPPL